jgi:hypothetical protein
LLVLLQGCLCKIPLQVAVYAFVLLQGAAARVLFAL